MSEIKINISVDIQKLSQAIQEVSATLTAGANELNSEPVREGLRRTINPFFVSPSFGLSSRLRGLLLEKMERQVSFLGERDRGLLLEGVQRQVVSQEEEERDRVNKWCEATGHTEPFKQENKWWAFPPNGAIPVPVPLAFESANRLSDRWRCNCSSCRVSSFLHPRCDNA